MKSPILAFLWQELRLSWIPIVCTCAASALFSLFCDRFGAPGDLSVMATTMLLVVLACVSPLLRSGGRESQTMPRYFVTLPIRSGFWASVHFLYGVGMMVLVSVCLFRFHASLFGTQSESLGVPDLSAWNVALFWGAFASLLEGVFLLIGCLGSPMLTGAALAAAVTVFIIGTATFGKLDSARYWNRAGTMWKVVREPLPPGNSKALFRGGPASVAPPASNTHIETQANTGTIAANAAAENPKNLDLKKVEATRAAMQEAHDAAVRAKGRYVVRKEAAPPRKLLDPPFLVSFWLVTLILGYLCSCAGVTCYRQGPSAILRTHIPFTAFGPLRRRQDFVSPEAAAVWFEWKRFGRYLPLLTCVPAAALVFIGDFSVSHEDLIGLAFMLSIASVALGVYMTLRRHWDHTSGADTFLFTLPMTTRALAAARLRMAAHSIGMASVVFLLSSYFIVQYGGGPYPEPSWVVLSLLVFVLCAWCYLWLALPFFYAGMLLAISVEIIGSAFRLRVGIDFAPLVLPLAALLAATVAVICLKAHKNRMLLGAGAAFMLILSMASAYLLVVCSPGSETYSRSSILLLVAVALIPVVPFATVPLSIRWYRHR